ncbi:unnamed protein product [Callosobruchus maculatus]|uniref:Uncharacterized protein n=1 Tax=Callosobruchus maculatus TaxID=64391 RepID=A0A653CN81_CALMS|nr:unnamed protein product [Callosobruchus maculatus]
MTFGAGLGFISIPKCPHSHKTRKQVVEISGALILLSFVFLAVLTSAAVIVMQDMKVLYKDIKHVTILKVFLEKYVLWCKVINVIIFVLSMVVHNKSYVECANFLLRIIDRRKYYGVATMLSTKYVKRMKTMTIWVWGVFLLYQVLALSMFLYKDLTLRNLIVTVAYGLMYTTVLVIALYIVHTTCAYTECFNCCYDAIKETLRQRLREGPEGKSALTKLQHLQKLYLHLVTNYKRHILSTGNVIYFSEQFIFTVQIYSDDVLSFLYKFPISKLTNIEADQVQMLVLSLTLEKPVMKASHMFTFGLPLVPVLVSNTVTYVLVALQFDQNLKSREYPELLDNIAEKFSDAQLWFKEAKLTLNNNNNKTVEMVFTVKQLPEQLEENTKFLRVHVNNLMIADAEFLNFVSLIDLILSK